MAPRCLSVASQICLDASYMASRCFAELPRYLSDAPETLLPGFCTLRHILKTVFGVSSWCHFILGEHLPLQTLPTSRPSASKSGHPASSKTVWNSHPFLGRPDGRLRGGPWLIIGGPGRHMPPSGELKVCFDSSASKRCQVLSLDWRQSASCLTACAD
jgi:hypothetical protein